MKRSKTKRAVIPTGLRCKGNLLPTFHTDKTFINFLHVAQVPSKSSLILSLQKNRIAVNKPILPPSHKVGSSRQSRTANAGPLEFGENVDMWFIHALLSTKSIREIRANSRALYHWKHHSSRKYIVILKWSWRIHQRSVTVTLQSEAEKTPLDPSLHSGWQTLGI